MGRTIHLELVASSRTATDLAAGGLFVQDKTLALLDTCSLVVFNDGGQLELAAKAVYIDGNGGVGLEVIGFDAALKAKLAELVAAGEAATKPENEPNENDAIDEPAAPEELDSGTDEERQQYKSLHERLRGLPLAQQIKRAREGDPTERMLLERMYGKNVWEALLRNPRLTSPEVARIARMGALPRPQVEVIINNGAWLQIPEVRRALLSNPRLGVDQILRVLRLMPKHELKLAAVQTAYTFAVRNAAKQMIKEGEK